MSIGSSKATQPVSASALPLPTGAAQDGADISAPTAMPAGGAGLRGWLSAIWTKLNGSLAVTGTFWQATQPVSLASMPSTPVTGTFWQATQPVSAAALPLPAGAAADGTDATGVVIPTGGVGIRGWLSSIYNKLNTSVAVTGAFFQATQPVSMATNTPDITDRAARLLGVIASITGALPAGANLLGKVGIDQTTPGTTNLVQVGGSLPAGANTIGAVNQGTAAAVASAWPVKNTDGVSTQAVKAASTAAAAADPAAVVSLSPNSPAFFKASDVVGTTLSGANAAATLSVAAGGAGLFLYISRIRITMHNTSAAAVAGSAVALAFTSTNIPGALAWTEGNALAAGTSKTVVDEYLDSPIKTTTANTATTIVLPACGAGVQARATLYGYYAP